MAQEGRPTGISYEDATDPGRFVDFDGAPAQVVSLKADSESGALPSARLELDLGSEYVVLIGYFSNGELMETGRERPFPDVG